MENNSPVSVRGRSGTGRGRSGTGRGRSGTRRSRSGTGHRSEPPSIPKRRRTGSAAVQSSPQSSGEGRDVVNIDDEDGAPAAAADEQSGAGWLSVVLSEALLECSICFHPLSIPVYQCINGHTLCSSCCERVHDQKCPTCQMKTGEIRCLAIESMLEAIKVPCSYKDYGCPKQISYSSKYSHELTCAYSQWGCPFTGCTFVGSHRSLSPHMNTKHVTSLVRLRFDQVCKFTMSLAEECVVFREEGEGKLFFLNKHDQMSISCFDDDDDDAPSGSGTNRFAYVLIVRGKDSSNRFQSLTNRFENGGKGGGVDCSTKDFIQVPSYLSDRNECLKVEQNEPFKRDQTFKRRYSKFSRSSLTSFTVDVNGEAHQA